MLNAQIICDACGKDLTSSAGVPKYRLHLTAESMSITGSSICSIFVQPCIDQDKHFCGLDCLERWASAENRTMRT